VFDSHGRQKLHYVGGARAVTDTTLFKVKKTIIYITSDLNRILSGLSALHATLKSRFFGDPSLVVVFQRSWMLLCGFRPLRRYAFMGFQQI
jgi:hypothetical protein